MEHLAWLLVLATLRGVFCLVEQPKGSLLVKMECIAQAFETCGMKRHLTYFGAFNHPMPKPTWLWSNLPDHGMRFLIMPKPAYKPENKGEYTKLTKKRTKEGYWWSGTKKLKSSEEYTQEYSDAVRLASAASQDPPF